MEHNNDIIKSNKSKEEKIISAEKYKHLSESERYKIQKLYHEGKNLNQIAKALTRDYKTIKHEFDTYGRLNQPSLSAKRSGVKKYRYYAKSAQKARNIKYIRDDYFKKYEKFIKWFIKNISPQESIEHLLQRFKKENKGLPFPCIKTVYNWCNKGLIKYSWGQKIVTKKGKRSIDSDVLGRKSIHQRKKIFGFELNCYKQRKHYEIDTIYNGDKKGGVLTLNERATRKLYAVQIKDRKAITINAALRKLIAQIGAHNILSITSDNGSEFAYSAVLEACYDFMWFYCDPYKSSQRGQNERLNRDVRKFFKKGTDIVNVSKKIFDEAIHKINNFSRRPLCNLSANEAMTASKSQWDQINILQDYNQELKRKKDLTKKQA